MADFKNGVQWYAKFMVDPDKFAVFFPEGKVCCGYCQMAYADGLNRPVCRFTRRIIEQPLFSENLPESCVLSATGEYTGTPPKKGD